jgi:5-(carboxyamino)imidazole ribonucleotide synthase
MNNPGTIGIVGGGQLGRMLSLAALPLGFKIAVVDPGDGSPSAQVGAMQITGNLYDEKALSKLSTVSDFMTVEIEHLDADILEKLEKKGQSINPAPSTIRLIQDKYEQKIFLDRAGIPVAPFIEITDKASAQKALKNYGKMLLKTRHGAYDGRGNMVIASSADIDKAFEHFTDKKLYAEKFVPFDKELAVMVARDTKSKTMLYPIVQTIHERNICMEVLAPAPIDDEIRKKAEKIAHNVAKHLNGAGVFGVEMFLTKQGDILINEIAPRVHNSGHYTIEATRTSQFEQHIRAITGLPLGSTDMTAPVAVMINILGERNGPTEIKGLDKVLELPNTSVHLYGKSPTKIDRKMGHITVTGNTLEETRRIAKKARKLLDI